MKEQAQQLKARLEQGGKANPFWICGPCVIESWDNCACIAETLQNISEKHKIPIVFKASFDKANRTSVDSFRGPGLEEGLEILQKIRHEFGLPLVTDVHETTQVPLVAEVVDILQIPAFLSRQTDLIAAAAKTGCLLNLKKGQFLSPSNITQLVAKLEHFGTSGFWITERGVSFGYQRLVVDFAALPEMESTGAHFILDMTHAVQLPGIADGVTGGVREAVPYLARAGAAVGFHGLFAETHPNPPKALSDGANAWPLEKLQPLMIKVKEIAETTHGL